MDELKVVRYTMIDRQRDEWPPINHKEGPLDWSYVHYGGEYLPGFYGGSYE